MKEKISKALPFLVVGVVVFMLLSLHFGWLNAFFFDTEHADVQGIDYFSAPKSYLNLLEKRSMFDTWGGTAYGPHSTWYLAHPAFSVFVGSWFSFFSPWTSYWLFTLFSVALMAFSGWMISRVSTDTFNQRLSIAVLLCAFPTYWLLFVGNIHAVLVVAITFILLGIFDLTYAENEQQGQQKLLAGLLISFFSKPVVLLMLPLLLFTKETRKTTIKSLVIYGIVSLIFIVVPMFNPEGVGLQKLMSLNTDFIKQNMNIYKNNFVLNAFMKDNAMHWFNLIAQSEYKLMHVDVYSLPVFVDTIAGRETPAGIYKTPIYLSMLLSFFVLFINDKKIRLEATLLLIMAISLTFFLSYNTVWEYQFTSALPVIALLPILKEKDVFYKKYIPVMFGIGLFFCLPSLYFLVRKSELNSNAITLIRADRVIPALLLFVMMTLLLFNIIKQHIDTGTEENAEEKTQ